ncbi:MULTISPECIES: helix-turn-helix domain-containing protein [unclassified Micromonospora]|uniref:helix-turn-helix domain-containing protein n=1 Tax=unclassified Micromonospora TaxID=2617518 RepID=UPI001C5F4AEE|nr:helix-turn-helix transcriptional regulator [Micromonospora sp. RL09-050-HVF-A]MBW4703216.1 helix-turn-helix transcriptional regulator [Micromonospora sp. RL09-050-HVF-A]
MPESGRLTTEIAALLRRERHAAALTQQQLADRAGTSQSAVARIERGERVPALPLVERLFAALGQQLAVTAEPLDSHLDARMDALAARSLDERIDELGLDRMLERLGDLPHLVTGGTAALLQGAPVPVDAVEIAVRWRDSARFTAWLEAAYGQRWNARWREFGGLYLEPEEPGEHYWMTRYGGIRAQLCDEFPEAIEVRHGGRGYRVVPLVMVELTDPQAAALLRRHRQRSAADRT